jgi:hypothetical protein
MPVYKRKYRSGTVAWYYQFALPGSTRQNQNLVTESGFATKHEATTAEAMRRTGEMVRQAATGGVAAPMPTTLSMLLAEFMKQHAEENLPNAYPDRCRLADAGIGTQLLGGGFGIPATVERAAATLLAIRRMAESYVHQRAPAGNGTRPRIMALALGSWCRQTAGPVLLR